MKTLAKSLHTITVLVNVAKHVRPQALSNAAAVALACNILGLAGMVDTYDLCNKALAQLEKAK